MMMPAHNAAVIHPCRSPTEPDPEQGCAPEQIGQDKRGVADVCGRSKIRSRRITKGRQNDKRGSCARLTPNSVRGDTNPDARDSDPSQIGRGMPDDQPDHGQTDQHVQGDAPCIAARHGRDDNRRHGHAKRKGLARRQSLPPPCGWITSPPGSSHRMRRAMA